MGTLGRMREWAFRLRAAYFARGGKVGKAPPGVRGGKNTSVFLCRARPGPLEGDSFEVSRGPTELFGRRKRVRRFSQEPWQREPGAEERQDACVSAARCRSM